MNRRDLTYFIAMFVVVTTLLTLNSSHNAEANGLADSTLQSPTIVNEVK